MEHENKAKVPDFIVKKIEDHYIIWLLNSNRFVQLKSPAWKVIDAYRKNIEKEKIVSRISKYYDIPLIEATKFVTEVIDYFLELNIPVIKPKEKRKITESAEAAAFPIYSTKWYDFGGKVVKFSYQSARYEYYTHPLFQHIEVDSSNSCTDEIEIFDHHEFTVIRHNGKLIDCFEPDEGQFVKGAIFTYLLEVLYNKPEKEWLTVIHASAVANKKGCVIFTARPGSGKSTIAALMKVNGLDILSDDFVPIDRKTKKVFAFPAAMSVKEGAIELLKPHFESLEEVKSYRLETRTVRFLPDNVYKRVKNLRVPAKALIFVQYNKDVDFELTPLSTLEALKSVFEEAWLAPTAENAKAFLNWIVKLPCYTLKYSNNEKAIGMISDLINR